jgi:hypothetical protein
VTATPTTPAGSWSPADVLFHPIVIVTPMNGRTLHLIDVENLASSPRLDLPTAARTAETYRRRITVREGDHVIVAADVRNAVAAGLAWPGARLRAGTGPDGADAALLDAVADTGWIAGHYRRVVIGSGDHAFAALASDLRARGVAVVVVAQPGNVSRWLRRAAGLVLALEDRVAVTPAA